MNRTRKSYYKSVKRDYQKKSSPNPFFHKKAPHKKSNYTIFRLILVIIILGTITWFFLASPVFLIKNIKISGLSKVSEQGIDSLIQKQTQLKWGHIFHQSNIFLFDKKIATQDIEDKFNVAQVKIRKKYPSTLSLTLLERSYTFIFKEGSNFYYASADGYITPRSHLGPISPENYFLVENDSSSTMITANHIKISSDYLNFIISLHKSLSSHPDLKATTYILDSEFNTVKIKFKNGPLVYFSVNSSAKSQVDNLVLVKNEKIKDNFNRTNYIDLRYGNRIFINPDFN